MFSHEPEAKKQRKPYAYTPMRHIAISNRGCIGAIAMLKAHIINAVYVYKEHYPHAISNKIVDMNYALSKKNIAKLERDIMEMFDAMGIKRSKKPTSVFK